MRTQLTILEIGNKIEKLKKKYGQCISNIILYKFDKNMVVNAIELECGIAFVIKEVYRNCVYFACVNKESIVLLLKEIESDVILEFISSELYGFEYGEFFEKSGFEKYTTFCRTTITYKNNPYFKPTTKRRKILGKFYNPSICELACISDAEEIMKMQKLFFDTRVDDVYTIEDLRRIIEQNCCVVAREKGEIIAYYVFRLEGKKLYSNLSVNRETADVLYSLERSVFDEYWEKGIRTFYWWVNMNNVAAMKRAEEDPNDILVMKKIYNHIYYKK